jgi:hypothetical protein
MTVVPLKIILRCQGGFCNRLRAIVSAVLWAEDIGAILEIYWPVEIGHMPCHLEQLIDSTSIGYLTQVHNGYIRAKQVLGEDDMRTSIVASQNNIIIQSYSIFHRDLEVRSERGLAALRKIRILPYLNGIADVEMPEGNYIGLHIRRTDHVKCIEASPLSAFEEFVSKVLSENPSTKFLLSTDDVSVKNRFSERFGSTIVSPIRTLGRMTGEQQELGVVDWLLLQKCSKIYASAGSSFSELAAWRAGIDLVRL